MFQDVIIVKTVNIWDTQTKKTIGNKSLPDAYVLVQHVVRSSVVITMKVGEINHDNYLLTWAVAIIAKVSNPVNNKSTAEVGKLPCDVTSPHFGICTGG